MKTILNVLLLTHNPLTCQNLTRYIKQQEQFHLVGVTDNVAFAESIIVNQDVKVLIMDMEDRSQRNDVIKLIDALYTYLINYKPFILVLTDICDTDILDDIHDSGADFIISKNKPDYSIQLIFDLLLLIYEKPKTPCRSHHDYYPRMLQIIHDELDAAGINHCHVGYTYLAEIILLFLDGKCVNLYAILSSHHGKSAYSITRAMQNAIDCAWQDASHNPLSQTVASTLLHSIDTQSSRGIPTVSEFIRYCVNKIRNM